MFEQKISNLVYSKKNNFLKYYGKEFVCALFSATQRDLSINPGIKKGQ